MSTDLMSRLDEVIAYLIGTHQPATARILKDIADDLRASERPAQSAVNITVWKDGSYLCQSEGDDYYSRNDPEWLCSIPLVSAYSASPPTAEAVKVPRKVLEALLNAAEETEERYPNDRQFSEPCEEVRALLSAKGGGK